MKKSKRPKWPSITEVARVLRGLNKYKSDDEGIDVRLQVYPNMVWAIRFGDASYDLDHLGYWGASSVPGSNRRFNAREVAKDLIQQAADMGAEDE